MSRWFSGIPFLEGGEEVNQGGVLSSRLRRKSGRSAKAHMVSQSKSGSRSRKRTMPPVMNPPSTIQATVALRKSTSS